MRVPHSLRTTPFHARTARLVQGQTWRRWTGYAAASCYEFPHDREYAVIRSAAALIRVAIKKISVGDAYDNAMAESWYNLHRRQSSLVRIAPINFERRQLTQNAA